MKTVGRFAVFTAVLALTLFCMSAPGAAQGQEFPEGQDLWRSCAACHCVPDQRVQDDENTRVAGQWVGYVHYALEQCRDIGKRCQPRKMGERVMKLSDEELRALAHYYASEK